MLKPPKLNAGATLGIVCPSYYIDKKIYQRTAQYFTQNGFRIIEGRTLNLRNNLYAGTPEERASDVIDFFRNPEVDAIVCARGGYGANRVVPLLDYNVIKNSPKIFIGFSDITALLLSITQKTGLVTFHGPMLTSYKNGFVEYNFKHFVDILCGKQLQVIKSQSDQEIKVLKHGKATGALWGGNLCLLINRLGTSGQLKTDGCILFIEDTGEHFYRLDRMLYHLKEAGTFDNIEGLVIGEMTDLKDTDPPFGYSIDEIVLDVCEGLDIPIITNFPCGHGKYQATLPISMPVELKTDNDEPMVTVLQSPVL